MKQFGGRLRGIAVDDTKSHLEFYDALFREADISIDCYESTPSAIAALKDIAAARENLDFIITDLGRVPPDGVEFIRYVRNLVDEILVAQGLRLKRIPILVVSADTTSGRRKRVEEIDPTILILQKPVRVEALLTSVQQSVAEYRRAVLNSLDQAGIGLVWENGAYRVLQAYQYTGRRGIIENPFWAGPHQGLSRSYTRLLLIADGWRFAETALSQFEALLSNKQTTEKDIHLFIERHPEFLGDAYDHFWSQPLLRSGKKIIRPDFVLQPRALRETPWNWMLLDLKKPSVPLLTRTRFHPSLTSHVLKVATQLKDYEAFFADPANATALKRRFGGIVPRPKFTALIGRLPQDQRERYSELRDQISGVTITTYDELLEARRGKVEWIKQFSE